MQDELIYEEIECVGENDCCGKSNKNYIVEIQGFLNAEDEFITKKEIEENPSLANGQVMDLFVIINILWKKKSVKKNRIICIHNIHNGH